MLGMWVESKSRSQQRGWQNKKYTITIMGLSPEWKKKKKTRFSTRSQVILTWMWEIDILANVDLHLDWSKLRPAHLVTLLNHPVKCRVNSHSRVRAVTCNTHAFADAEDQSKASVSAKQTKSRRQQSACNWKCYPGRRFPKARCRKTRRHSRTCTHSRKCSLGTSTWPADEPAGETRMQAFFRVCKRTCTSFTHTSFFLKELELMVLFPDTGRFD